VQLIASRMKYEKGRDIVDACAADPDLLVRILRSTAENHNHDASTPTEERAAVACEDLEAVMMWRGAQGVDAILDTDLPFADEFHQSWPVTIHGCDAFGHPVVAERIEDIATEGLARNMDKAAVLRHRVQIMEAVGHLKRREGGRRGYALYKHIWVIDLAGLKAGTDQHDHASLAAKRALHYFESHTRTTTLQHCHHHRHCLVPYTFSFIALTQTSSSLREDVSSPVGPCQPRRSRSDSPPAQGLPSVHHHPGVEGQAPVKYH